MNYRREIDGLRALAVLPVIFFHAGSDLFSGGFVGVDVFFVISGYLITSILVAEGQAGTLTLAGFYERRARRILPALFVVMLACLPFAWFWLLPADFKLFSESMAAVAIFSSNILFYSASNYFEADSALNPLIHTWSLAVEEQYYVLFPVFLLLAWRLGRRWTITILVGAAIGSLAAAQWASLRHPSFAFYMLPTRGWEILCGAFVAYYLIAKNQAAVAGKFAGACSLLGLLLIAGAVFFFDGKTPFPGLFALVPTLGAVLVILFASPQTIAGQLLGSRALVGIGLISYSAYLWHQPLFAFARHRSSSEPGQLLLAALALAALLLAYLTWKFVETPFRNRQRYTRRQVIALAVLCSGMFMSAGIAGYVQNGFDNRLTPAQAQIAAYDQYDFADSYRRYRCFLEPGNNAEDFAPECHATTPGMPTLLVWGDSYAAALAPGLRKVHANVIQYTASACPPIIDTVIDRREHCRAINRFVMSEIARLQPDRVFLHANWYTYERSGALQNLKLTLARIRQDSPATRVTVVGGVPQWSPTLPTLLIRRNVTLDRDQFLRLSAYRQLANIDSQLALVAPAHGARFVSALSKLCQGEDCQAVVTAGTHFAPTAWDNGHLTEAGSRLLAGKLIGE